MNQGVFIVDHSKCSGCRTCEVICSLSKAKRINLSKSRIHVLKWDYEGLDFPHVFQQCTLPYCIVSCPSEAISIDEKTNARVVDEGKCTGCKTCVNSCPFKAITVYEETALICDLCNGKPKCVEYCPTKAIIYVPMTWNGLMEKTQASVKLLKALRRFDEILRQ